MKDLLKIKLIIILSLIVLSSCTSDDNYVGLPSISSLDNRLIELYGSKHALVQPSSTDYSAIPADINNPITAAKVELGKLLFHETSIATVPLYEESKFTYSCASCHHADAGFQSGIRQGIGEGGVGFGLRGEGREKNPMYQEQFLDVQPVRSPTILNVAYQEAMLWNGQFGAKGINEGTQANWTPGTPKENNNLGFEGVEIQAVAGLGVHRLKMEASYIINSGYKALFDAAFPNIPESERYTQLNGALAIAAYERTVLSNQAPFQRWLKGDKSAMTPQQIEGAKIFFGKANCFACHSGPALNSMTFHAYGMNDLAGPEIATVIDDATKRGRGGFTGNPEDDYKFKTPQLYNLKDGNFLGHGSSFNSVRAVVEYKNAAEPQNPAVPLEKLSELFIPLNLTSDEINQLVAFVEDALYDPNLLRYVPEQLPSGNCFPNADPMSSEDLGCNQ
jgi:cytochrome c peroxidase